MLALEHGAAHEAAAALQAQLAALGALIVTLWLSNVGKLTEPATADQMERILPQIREVLDSITFDHREDVRTAVGKALAMGVRHGEQQSGTIMDETAPQPSTLVEYIIEQTVPKAQAAIRNAAAEAETATTFAELASASKTANGAANTIEANTRWVVNRSVAEGVESVALANDTKLVWRAERDACIVCLSYAGSVRGASGFDPIEVFDGKSHGTIENPPEHPNCRCQLIAWNGYAPAGPGEALPQALATEARRSVVKGWALPTESQVLRRKAADQLLKSGARLPRTVEQRARAQVRSRRRFTRPVP